MRIATLFLFLFIALSASVKAQESDIFEVDTVVHVEAVAATQALNSQLYNRPVGSFSHLMQGMVAGMQVASGRGEAGSDSQFLVRGPSSFFLPSNPVIIVDEVLYLGGMSSLNPRDIESITIRKDAAGTVLAGTCGANGVVEVTTRHGRKGVQKVDLHVSQGVSGRSIPEYKQEGVSEYIQQPPYAESKAGQLHPYRTGRRSEYAVDLSGGGDLATYYTSIGYLNDEGYVRYSAAKRYTGLANMQLTPAHWFRMSANLSFAKQQLDTPTSLNGSSIAELGNLLYSYNPEVENVSEFDNLKLRGIINAQLRCTGWLMFDLNAGLEDNRSKADVFSFDGYQSAFTGREQSTQLVPRFTFSYQSDLHSLAASVGLERVTNSFDLQNVAAESESSSTLKESEREISWFGAFTYGFCERYYLSSAIRQDRVEVGDHASDWFTFWSVSGTWMVSKEKFFSSLSVFDKLLLTASYGKVGNSGMGSFFSKYSLYEILSQSDRWEHFPQEISFQTDLTLNISMLHSRLFIKNSYFRKRVENPSILLMHQQTTSSPIELATPFGELLNTGWELTVSGFPVTTKKLTWLLSANATTYRSRVKNAVQPSSTILQLNDYQRLAAGKSPYEFYLPSYRGINPVTGSAMYLATTDASNAYVVNGSRVVSSTSEAEQMDVGSAIPSLFGGFNSNLRYEKVSLSVAFSYQLGGKVYDYAYQSSRTGSASTEEAGSKKLSRDASAIATSTYYLANAGYLSLRSVVLSYSLPKRWIRKLYMVNAEVYAAGENIWLLSARRGLYPAGNFYGIASSTYVPARTIALGLNVGF